jgi:hypothetical protein
VVNVADGADVDMRFRSLKLLFSHVIIVLLVSVAAFCF